jgi:hypothetical protein
MVTTTKAQRLGLKRLWQRIEYERRPTYRYFRRWKVQPTIGCDGAVAVNWCNMWVCIERDGYAHS